VIIALLGKKDRPTDAIEDYSRLLGGAFRERGLDFELVRVAWDETGWPRALLHLWRTSVAWKGAWALVQYTALQWSRRGFPFLVLPVLCVLKVRGLRVAVVFHDQGPYGGQRCVDRIRRVCQRTVMLWAYRVVHASILATPPETASWLPTPRTKAAYIPIGANVPANHAPSRAARTGQDLRTITVFAVTDAGDISKEVADIALAARRAAARFLCVRLLTLGRGSQESERKVREALEGSSVDFHALGILPADQVAQVLAGSDVSLFVRGPITSQRGSAIASIATGVPLVSYANPTLAGPLAEAGVIGVPFPDGEKLAEATVRVLTDPELWRDLHERSRLAYQKYFSWETVASRFLELLIIA
jgi:glycosyltransferase involved in cell wall biosynthesis